MRKLSCFIRTLQGDSGGALTTEAGTLVGLVSSAGALQCGKVNIFHVNHSSPSYQRTFIQENVFDIYTDIAAYMTWIGRTIKKMGGMLACDLVIEETNPEGDYFSYFYLL